MQKLNHFIGQVSAFYIIKYKAPKCITMNNPDSDQIQKLHHFSRSHQKVSGKETF